MGGVPPAAADRVGSHAAAAAWLSPPDHSGAVLGGQILTGGPCVPPPLSGLQQHQQDSLSL